MIEDSKNIKEELTIINDQQLKSLGLKKTTAFVRDDTAGKSSNKNAAVRQARYRNKEKTLKELFKDLGAPPRDIIEFVKNNGWNKVSESISISKKYSNLPRFIRWILG